MYLQKLTNAGNGCVWYLVNFFLDMSVGMLIAYILFKIIDTIAVRFEIEVSPSNPESHVFRPWKVEFTRVKKYHSPRVTQTTKLTFGFGSCRSLYGLAASSLEKLSSSSRRSCITVGYCTTEMLPWSLWTFSSLHSCSSWSWWFWSHLCLTALCSGSKMPTWRETSTSRHALSRKWRPSESKGSGSPKFRGNGKSPSRGTSKTLMTSSQTNHLSTSNSKGDSSNRLRTGSTTLSAGVQVFPTFQLSHLTKQAIGDRVIRRAKTVKCASVVNKSLRLRMSLGNQGESQTSRARK